MGMKHRAGKERIAGADRRRAGSWVIRVLTRASWILVLGGTYNAFGQPQACQIDPIGPVAFEAFWKEYVNTYSPELYTQVVPCEPDEKDKRGTAKHCDLHAKRQKYVKVQAHRAETSLEGVRLGILSRNERYHRVIDPRQPKVESWEARLFAKVKLHQKQRRDWNQSIRIAIKQQLSTDLGYEDRVLIMREALVKKVLTGSAPNILAQKDVEQNPLFRDFLLDEFFTFAFPEFRVHRNIRTDEVTLLPKDSLDGIVIVADPPGLVDKVVLTFVDQQGAHESVESRPVASVYDDEPDGVIPVPSGARAYFVDQILPQEGVPEGQVVNLRLYFQTRSEERADASITIARSPSVTYVTGTQGACSTQEQPPEEGQRCACDFITGQPVSLPQGCNLGHTQGCDGGILAPVSASIQGIQLGGSQTPPSEITTSISVTNTSSLPLNIFQIAGFATDSQGYEVSLDIALPDPVALSGQTLSGLAILRTQNPNGLLGGTLVFQSPIVLLAFLDLGSFFALPSAPISVQITP
jgi:hypothetical protein